MFCNKENQRPGCNPSECPVWRLRQVSNATEGDAIVLTDGLEPEGVNLHEFGFIYYSASQVAVAPLPCSKDGYFVGALSNQALVDYAEDNPNLDAIVEYDSRVLDRVHVICPSASMYGPENY